jgi:hypothetical protein
VLNASADMSWVLRRNSDPMPVSGSDCRADRAARWVIRHWLGAPSRDTLSDVMTMKNKAARD